MPGFSRPGRPRADADRQGQETTHIIVSRPRLRKRYLMRIIIFLEVKPPASILYM